MRKLSAQVMAGMLAGASWSVRTSARRGRGIMDGGAEGRRPLALAGRLGAPRPLGATAARVGFTAGGSR
jgi:hypothetical protein